jgi:HlyD family secretion protein
VDIARPEIARKKKMRRYIYAGAGLLVAVVITGALSRLKPAAPSVDRSTIWTDTVRRGPMRIEVRGLGTLVPETIVWLPAPADGRVDKHLLAGITVKKDTVVMELSDSQLEQTGLNAEYALKGAQAAYEQTKATLQNQLMDKRTSAANIASQYQQAKLQADSNEKLAAAGLVSDLILKQSEVAAEELGKQDELAKKEVETFENSIPQQLAVQQATVDEDRALDQLYKSQLNQMKVRAGIDGVLQEVDAEVGQKITQGTVLAKVANQTQLKAALEIAETQAKDVQIGQKASIDTHNGLISGHVMRIDPAVVNGTRTVDVHLDGALPEGAVPQLSIEGTIEIENLADVLFVGRPVHGDPESTAGLFKLVDDGKEGVRVQVQLGRASVNTIEIVKGLELGDQVILSDMSAEDNFDRVELK